MVGAFRVGVPRYDQRGIREAINNALIHRDYGQLGAVHVQLHDDYALVTNEARPSVSALSTTQVEEQIMAHVRQHGRIQRGDVEALSGLSRDQAYRVLKHLVEQRKLERVGRGRVAHYRLTTPSPEDKSR